VRNPSQGKANGKEGSMSYSGPLEHPTRKDLKLTIDPNGAAE
jgi:hypothetical protein